MSAISYVVCPVCGEEADNLLPNNHPERTLREDKFIGMTPAKVVEITYSATCNRCGFETAYKAVFWPFTSQVAQSPSGC